MRFIDPLVAGGLAFGRPQELSEVFAAGAAADPALVRAVVQHPERARKWLQTPGFDTRGTPLVWGNPGYPPMLAEVPDPPAMVLVEGELGLFGEPAVAIVGTRQCTAYGRRVAFQLGRALSERGVVVVSGLARGIDAEAHAGALPTGRTIAVLGHGLGHMSPASNRGLRDQLLARGGAVVSTWPDDFPPAPWTFPERNQWIAGLSRAVIVVEAPTRSGALHTVGAAVALERPVYAVPAAIGAPASAGCLELLGSGDARIITDVDAFADHLAGRTAPRATGDLWLARLVAGDPIDEVARLRGITTAEMLQEVTRLELAGRLVRLPGRRYAPVGAIP